MPTVFNKYKIYKNNILEVHVRSWKHIKYLTQTQECTIMCPPIQMSHGNTQQMALERNTPKCVLKTFQTTVSTIKVVKPRKNCAS